MDQMVKHIPQQAFRLEQESRQVHWWQIILSQTLARVQPNEEQGQVEEIQTTVEDEGNKASHPINHNKNAGKMTAILLGKSPTQPINLQSLAYGGLS